MHNHYLHFFARFAIKFQIKGKIHILKIPLFILGNTLHEKYASLHKSFSSFENCFFIFIIYSTLEELLQSLTVLTIFSQISIKCNFNILNMLPYNMIIYTLIIDVVGLILLIKVYQTVKYEETL